jgi:large conductance mechanosensitive channel
MIKGFKEFLLRGNVVDLAVAFVIGVAFAGVIGAFTEKIINPIIASVGGNTAGAGLGFQIREGNDKTFVDFGALITATVNFIIVAAAVYFIVVVPMNKIMSMRKSGAEPEPEAPAEDVIVLQEIRDLLRERPTV